MSSHPTRSPRPGGRIDRSDLDPATAARLHRVWRRAYDARTTDDLRALYADWASTYDADHEAIGFFGHRVAAELLAEYTPFAPVAPILDAGAGTGAAGEALHELGFHNLTAVDFSADMLARARQKGIYRTLRQADLGAPLDAFPSNAFDATILVGVFSYGQAPAHALDEILRLTRPGGVVVLTMRADFFEEDAMGVRSKLEELERGHAWKTLRVTDPLPYLPNKDPDAEFRVWCFRVLETKEPAVDESFAAAVREALSAPGPIKRIDHAFIWNSTASRLYESYTECADYYLTDCELEILQDHAPAILGDAELIVELGCGSARKVRHLLAAAAECGRALGYTPVDVSAGAVQVTAAEVAAEFGGSVRIEPRCGRFDDVLASIPVGLDKLIVFFGGSLGNLETLEMTVDCLRQIRDRMQPTDRFVVGLDLDKDVEVLRRAYEAGPANRAFFVNMLRRINDELGGNLDLEAFRQWSPYEPDRPHEGIETRCVQLRLRTERPQNAYLARLHMEVQLAAGDSVQIGTSRKFRPEQIGRLAELAGLEVRRQWLDRRRYFALTELVPAAQSR